MTLELEIVVNALNDKNIQTIIEYTRNNKNSDLVSELYNSNLLSKERLEFIVRKCMNYLDIPTALVKKLWENNEISLLDIILNSLKFFDNDFIIRLLSLYQNKNSTEKVRFQFTN
ncbi:hypothetical protein LY90DRAFT_511734 [Neocallimastix californiae]|jgi:hypothetical protein|uniref:Uncharacterized protein n=1 Tax=Neocallimastix californiae TaxID=1754190 RepID=A0A1Y2BK01_9FUNG|nr:hypothetical protein LY90DRAFT_511734 [Neocallimastix californiae]|eukprot:ORY35101.1 hypothetical protein LY90DRAFT_511734 [Neocallimastix californiae]